MFYYDYDDIQLPLFRSGLPFPEVVNATSAEVFGAEAEAQLAAFPGILEGLELEGSIAWLDATFSNLTALDPNNPGADPDRDGNRLPRAPELAAFAAAQYRLASARYGALIPRLEYRYQSGIFFSIFEDRFARQGAYGLWNARLRWEHPRGGWYVVGFAENLSDARYAQNVIRSDGVFGKLSFWGPRRTYGFQVGVEY